MKPAMKPAGPDWGLLIHRHLDGTLSEEDARLLEGGLRNDPRLRRRLAEMAFEQNQLRDLLGQAQVEPIVVIPADAREPVEPRSMAPLLRPAPSTSRRKLPGRLLVAAAVFVALSIAAVITLRPASSPAPFEVVSGEVRIQESRVDAGGTAPARLRLTDGSEVLLAPSSAAVFRGAVGDARQVVELAQGAATFSVTPGKGLFRVDTAIGRVAVLGTRFQVELRKSKKRPLLAIAVSEGRVRVEYGEGTRELGAGESHVFGAEGDERRDPKPAVFVALVRGKVLALGDAHLQLAVERVVKASDPAAASELLGGRTIRVVPATVRRESGETEPDRNQMQYLRRLQVGQDVTIELRRGEGDEWRFGKLERDPGDAPKREDRDKKPRDPGQVPDRERDK